MKLINLTGARFGKLVVLSMGDRKPIRWQKYWLCRCDCGSEKEILGYNLRHGHSTSCGCQQKLASVENRKKCQPMRGLDNPKAKKAKARSGAHYIASSDVWYRICSGRWYSAKRRGIPVSFNTVQEFATYCKGMCPERCPVFGVKLKRGSADMALSPSVDRIEPNLGYVRGNIQIISNKANRMKHSASTEELRAFAEWVLR